MNSSTNGLQDLHREFVRLGLRRNKITYQLLALLPAIYRQGIYKEKGYATIFEYAGKLAGLSRLVVEKTLRVAHHLEDKPHLQAAIKTEGIHKVAMVATLATPKTEKAWADKVCNMSKGSLFELAKEHRGNIKALTLYGEDQVAHQSPSCQAAPQKMIIELDEEMQFLFLKLKKKLGKKSNNMNNKEALRQLLLKFTDTEKSQKKTATARKLKQRDATYGKSVPGNGFGKCITRYIPVEQKRAVLRKTNDRCGYTNCNKPFAIFHHRQRFLEKKSHESIIPLCKEHHEFMHNGLIENETSAPENWKLRMRELPEKTADLFFRKYRKAAHSL